MARTALRRTVAALTIATTVIGIGATEAQGQDDSSSTVTIGGGTTDVEASGTWVLAPGVTISGGEVSNATGIGVNLSGGTSAGTAPGGGTNAAAPE